MELTLYSQETELGIEGGIEIGDVVTPIPDSGTIRFNPATNDFEGWDGTQWWSLTNKTSPQFEGIEDSKIIASDGAEFNRFGYSVSISGDDALIGAFGDDAPGTNSGSAYFFK